MARLETGPVEPVGDWPGIFIRGDNALGFSLAIQSLLMKSDDAIARATVKSLGKLLKTAHVQSGVGAVQIIPLLETERKTRQAILKLVQDLLTLSEHVEQQSSVQYEEDAARSMREAANLIPKLLDIIDRDRAALEHISERLSGLLAALAPPASGPQGG